MQICIFSNVTPVSHDPSEIILICWFAALETRLIMFKTVELFNIFAEAETYFSGFPNE